jgi:hypothetical protein
MMKTRGKIRPFMTLFAILGVVSHADAQVVDTAQDTCWDGSGREISCPAAGQASFGQDAQIHGNQPDFVDNGDGTVTDLTTGLMWQQDHAAGKLTHAEAQAYVTTVNNQRFAGYGDWRLPTIKQLYSLIDFRGMDPPPEGSGSSGLQPFIDTDVFEFSYGDTDAGERIIDSQWVTTSLYVADDSMMFGVNFADGRIKAYPKDDMGGSQGEKTFYVRLCRGNTGYGTNDFTDNGDGTITDSANGLMWTRSDSGSGMTWEDALAWVEQKNSESHLGHDDWRMPNAKELQSLVDYSRSPDTTGTPAIDPVFQTTAITNEYGGTDYPFFWTGTTHIRSDGTGDNAVYIAFGRGLGYMNGQFVDIHGAGCQRSDPKDGSAADFPRWGYGPQGDVQRVFNFVRLVRDADESTPGELDHTTWVEIAANLEGVGSTEWRTDLVIRNTSAADAAIALVLHAEDGEHSLSTSISGSTQAVYEDVVGLLGVSGKGALEVRSDQPLDAVARIYNVGEHGTYGGSLVTAHADAGLSAGESAWLLGLRQLGNAYRTNLSVTNVGDDTATVVVDLLGTDGSLLHGYTLTVEPSQVVQDLQPFKARAGKGSLGWGFARVTVESGHGVLASASVIDSRTGDSTIAAMTR